MSSLTVKAAVCSDIGVNRSNNEDNYYLNGKYIDANDDSSSSTAFMSPVHQAVVAVFDGMGGQSKGEFASLCAAKTLDKYTERILREGTRQVNEYIDDVNDKICDEMKYTNQRIGSTAVLLTINNNIAQAYNLGDSRAYYMHKGKLYHISRDHTVADQLYRMKMLTKAQAKADVRRNRLTKHLGMFKKEADLCAYASGSIKMTGGDMFLLCSDGVTNAVSDRELRNILMSCGEKCKHTVNAVVQRALDNGSSDNITAIAVRVCSHRSGSNSAKNKRWGRHPRLYPFLLGVGLSAVVFTVLTVWLVSTFIK